MTSIGFSATKAYHIQTKKKTAPRFPFRKSR